MLARWLKETLLFTSDRSLSFLLFLLLALIFVVYPYFAVTRPSRYVIDVFVSMVLISGTFAVQSRRWRQIAFVLAALTLVARWASYAGATRELLIANSGLAVAFLSFATAGILLRVVSSGPVTRHRIEGAVAVYLLIGVIFASLYSLIALVQPEAFQLSAVTEGGTVRQQYDRLTSQLTYYSFITLTTVGYGDVAPIDPLAKQFAVLEGLVGQLYPAILLARLVSLELADRKT